MSIFPAPVGSFEKVRGGFWNSPGGYTPLQPALQSLLSPAYLETGRGPEGREPIRTEAPPSSRHLPSTGGVVVYSEICEG